MRVRFKRTLPYGTPRLCRTLTPTPLPEGEGLQRPVSCFETHPSHTASQPPDNARNRQERGTWNAIARRSQQARSRAIARCSPPLRASRRRLSDDFRRPTTIGRRMSPDPMLRPTTFAVRQPAGPGNPTTFALRRSSDAESRRTKHRIRRHSSSANHRSCAAGCRNANVVVRVCCSDAPARATGRLSAAFG